MSNVRLLFQALLYSYSYGNEVSRKYIPSVHVLNCIYTVLLSLPLFIMKPLICPFLNYIKMQCITIPLIILKETVFPYN